jgi:galactokinase
MDVAGRFQQQFGYPPAVVASAPGRVNLLGEHTDYNEGFVLPVALPLRTTVALAPRADDRVCVGSSNLTGNSPRTYRLGEEIPGGGWLDYVQGVTARLRAEGHSLPGLDVWIASDLPLGSGLASSAALLVALLRALRAALALPLDDLALARLAQRVENAFVGARVGIMDQLAASLGESGSALFLDTRALRWERIPLPRQLGLVVLDSGVAHQHAAGDYNTRRAECERACALLGVTALRDIALADLPRVAALPSPLRERARHVVTENARVLEAVAALRAGDLPRLGALCRALHASQRDDYAVSLPAIDRLVALAEAEPGVYGARLTGGGFGGAILVLVDAAQARTVGARIVAAAAALGELRPRLLLPPRCEPL